MKKRKSLKQLLMVRVIVAVAIIILVITEISINRQVAHITDLTESLLSRESITYSNEIYNWWSLIQDRVWQTANIWKNSPDMTYDEAHALLLALTEADPDSQDIYVGYGDDMTFLDGSGWVPDADFVFTDRAWYKGALERGGEIYTSDPYIDASTGKTCLACAIKLDDNVVLSSDITFDQMAEKMNSFKSSADSTKIYIINKETQDILLSTDQTTVGTVVSQSTDPVIKGLGAIMGSLNTSRTMDEKKIITAPTDSGKYMYAATEVEGTSWVVVSATPYSVIDGKVFSSSMFSIFASVVLLILLAVMLYFMISKYLNPVTHVTGKIGDLSEGDFTAEMKTEGNNEITTLSEKLNGYISRMREMLLHLSGISDDMNESASNCMSISDGLTASNSSQSDSIEHLNACLEGLNRSIEDVASAAGDLAATSTALVDDSNKVRDLCSETVKSSEEGKAEMKNMTENFTTLNGTINDLIQIIHATSETVDEIKGITETINSISSQTNLLSLNASIEAARAGEMGKGFAVVASEVGSLATQSTEATQDISVLVETITKNIMDINTKADECLRDMESCLSGVERSNHSFESIFRDVTNATEAISDITDGISRINDVATGNAASTEEQVATVNEILDLSEQIVTESDKISSETTKLQEVSNKLNGYSSGIVSDLKNFKL